MDPTDYATYEWVYGGLSEPSADVYVVLLAFAAVLIVAVVALIGDGEPPGWGRGRTCPRCGANRP